ncbi:hypothetical protein [Thalassomonas actiniarum]|uniref:Uncharacterized protein n=1 Tax=Thalassomonas actiniarum TaxID=485447 RepID=A0AAE9YUY8_9GAMM|nr:hypothetical protein [Thalassomonas actiniarum]WDE01611.1 hypothetical protein SG35_013900 [Thalassomonas actiniarum]
MKDNHETDNREGAEQEISNLYRQMAKEQPPGELDNTILHLARNKELLTAEAEVKPVSFIERIKARSGPLAMAASVVLVGSVVLLQDWRQELVPKRYGPQSGDYDHVTPQAEQTLQPAPIPPATQAQKETGALEQLERYQAAEQVENSIVQQQEGVVLDEKPLTKQTDARVQSRFRSQPEVEQLFPAADTQLDNVRLKTEFGGAGQEAAAKVPEVQAFTAPAQRTGATKIYDRPAKTQSKDKAKQDEDSQQLGVKATSMSFSQKTAQSHDVLQQKRITAWLSEIDQLLAAGEQAKAIEQLTAFVAANPDYPLAEKYQKLLPQLEPQLENN